MCTLEQTFLIFRLGASENVCLGVVVAIVLDKSFGTSELEVVLMLVVFVSDVVAVADNNEADNICERGIDSDCENNKDDGGSGGGSCGCSCCCCCCCDDCDVVDDRDADNEGGEVDIDNIFEFCMADPAAMLLTSCADAGATVAGPCLFSELF